MLVATTYRFRQLLVFQLKEAPVTSSDLDSMAYVLVKWGLPCMYVCMCRCLKRCG